MQSKDYAEYVRQIGRLSVEIKPADESPVRQTAALACFHLLSAATQLERARDHMAIIEASSTPAPGD
jgi:hypothetical protein